MMVDDKKSSIDLVTAIASVRSKRNHPKEMLVEAERLLKTIRQLPDYAEVFWELYLLAGIEFLFACYETAAYDYAIEQGLIILTEVEEKESDTLAQFLSELSEHLSLTSQFNEALTYLEKAYHLQIRLEAPESAFILTHRRMGQLYLNLEDYPKAIEQYGKGLVISERCQDTYHTILFLNNLCIGWYRHGDNIAAIDFGKRSIALSNSWTKDRKYVQLFAYTNNNIGAAYIELGDFEQALTHFQQGLNICREIEDKRGELYSLRGLGRIAIAQGDHEIGIQYLQNALALSETIQSDIETYRSLKVLADGYEDIGDSSLALQYHRRYHQLYKTVFDEQKQRSLRRLEVIYRTEVAQVEAKTMRSKNKELEQLVAQRVSDLQASFQREKMLAKQLKEALDISNRISKIRSQMIKTISHQFRTPLTMISMSSQLLFTHYDRLSMEKREQHYSQVQDSTAYLSQILRDIVHADELNGDKTKARPRQIDFTAVHTQLTQAVAEIGTDNRVQIIQHSLSTNQVLDIDMALLTQAVIPVVKNALGYSNTAVTMTLSFDQMLTITIQDQGIGIDPEDLPHVLNPFYRGKNTMRDRGMGMGLYITQHVLALMGGTIDVVSAGLEQGTMVMLRFPI